MNNSRETSTGLEQKALKIKVSGLDNAAVSFVLLF
jgi:hypothetical protein